MHRTPALHLLKIVDSSAMAALPKTYRAWVIESVNAPLRLQEVELKQPGAGEVLIKVLVCGVCYTDVAVQKGELGDNLFPRVPGHEITGDVVALGYGVQGFSLGQRVGGAWLGGEHPPRHPRVY